MFEKDRNGERLPKMDKIQYSADHHVIDHFRKKSLFFQYTRYNQEYDSKNRLSIPGPSSEKPVAEIARIKKSDLNQQPYQFNHTDTLFF